MSLTIYRDECIGQEWLGIVDHPVKFALDVLQISDDEAMVASPWGRSWMNNKGKCEPNQAMSFQCHTRIPLNRLERWMRCSGNHGVYVVPKNEDGTIDSKYMVIWIDQDAIELVKTAIDLPNHLGLKETWSILPVVCVSACQTFQMHGPS